MISFSDLCLMRGSRVLIENAAAAVYPGQKIGVIGRNGCGKSSLFAALKGELAPESGTLSIPRDLKISSVSQQTPSIKEPALEYVIDGDRELRSLQERRKKAEEAGDGEKIALLEDELGLAGAWTVKSRAEILLHGLGFADDEMEKNVCEFSGGWRMRLNLAQALIARSQLLLLDEPTNHLDLDTILFLENYLKGFEGTIMCISHDRDFLDTFTDHILHFESGKVVMYTGNYSDYERLRAERIRSEQASRRKEEAAVAHMQAFVERFRYKASKAKQAQSMLKAIDRVRLTAVTQEESPFSFSFPEPERTVDVLADIRDLDAGYEAGRPVLKNISLSLFAGDRVGLLGRNGQGKSTLIKTLCGIIRPLNGTFSLGKDIRIGYFAQHEMDSLNEELSPVEHLLKINPKAREGDLRSFLGSFAFSGDKALSRVKTFSGGEQARLALAIIAYQKPNLLLLDEPTNHLDLETREALSVALASYSGALILVSHDRYLLEAIADKLWLVDDGKAAEFDGSIDDYRDYLAEKNRQYAEKRRGERQDQRTPDSRKSGFKSKEQKQKEAALRQSLRPLKQEIARLEEKMAALDEELARVDEKLADSALYQNDKNKVGELLKKRGVLASLKDDAENAWLLKSAELEEKEAQGAVPEA